MVKAASLDSMSLSEIESYGKDIQNGISNDVSSLISGVRSIELGEVGKQVSDMVSSAQSIVKRTETKGILKVLNRPKKWLEKYDTVENKINNLDSAVDTEIERLTTVLNGCYENGKMLEQRLAELEESEHILNEMLVAYEGDDMFKINAATNRQKVLLNTIALIRQEIGKSMLVILQNKEITNQLIEARDNVIPYIKIILINTLASKANSEAIALKKSMKKIANAMVVQTAKEISANADEMIKGRNDTILDSASIQEANKILVQTYEKIRGSMKDETESNRQLVDSLKTSIQFLSDNQIISVKEGLSSNE